MTETEELRRWAVEQAVKAGAGNVADEAARIMAFVTKAKGGHTRTGRQPNNAWKTPERLDLIRAQYETVDRLYKLSQAVNALPGGWASTQTICAWANRMGLHRPTDGPLAQRLAANIAARRVNAARVNGAVA